MEEKFSWKKFFLFSFITILLGIWIGSTYDKKQTIPSESAVPQRPDRTREMYYDFDEEEWRYLFRGDSRAKEVEVHEGLTKDELQKYLEKKIPGYLEDTYWGEEYDLDHSGK